MGYDLPNAALIACCVLALIVAAAFFPAAGYGDFPDQEAVSDDAYTTSPLPAESGETDNDSSESDDQEGGDEADDTDDSEESDDDTDSTGQEADVGSDGTTDEREGVALIGILGPLTIVLLVLSPLAVIWRYTHPDHVRAPRGPGFEPPEGIVPRLQFRLKRIPQATMHATLSVASFVPALTGGATRTARGVGHTASLATQGLSRGLRGVTFGSLGLLSSIRGIGSISLTSGLTAFARGLGGEPRSSRSTPSTDARDRAPAPSTATTAETGPRTIEDVWLELVSMVTTTQEGRAFSRSRRRPQSPVDATTKTPGEYARAAIDAGYPRGPVSTITNCFRQVRYGSYSSTAERKRQAFEAYEALQADADETRGDDE